MDIRILKEFVAEVLTTCKNDFDGVTCGLEDKAYQAGVELGMSKKELDQLYEGGTIDEA